MRWNWWSLYWLLWLGAGFGVPETVALVTRRPQDTLSAQVWHAEGNGPTAVRYAVGAFLLWLLVHMVWKLFR
jgi:hypothetical protein